MDGLSRNERALQAAGEQGADPAGGAAEVEAASAPYVAGWRRLVSLTNWEKGRIICQWREELIRRGAPAAAYSDEAWSRRVGGVTPQHVGRLRRVFQRFGEVHDQYEGLFWSHFLAAIDWDDAEMWLEGAVQNGWTVEQMRRTRWETVEGAAGAPPAPRDVVDSDLDEDAPPWDPIDGPPAEDAGAGKAEAGGAAGAEEGALAQIHPAGGEPEGPEAAETPLASHTSAESPPPIFADLDELPDDVAEACELFKLAIVRHKAEGWRRIERPRLLAVLDALKTLALAEPGAGDGPPPG